MSRGYFYGPVELPPETVADIRAQVEPFAPGVDLGPALDRIALAMGESIAQRKADAAEPSIKDLRRHAERISKLAFGLADKLGAMPSGLVDALRAMDYWKYEATRDRLREDLETIGLMTGDLALHQGRDGPRPKMGRYTDLAIEVGSGLRAIGIEPSTGTENPFEAVLEIAVRTLDPKRTGPDVRRYAASALKRIRAQ